MTSRSADNAIPRPGMPATVRKRRGIVTAVDPFDGETGRLHLVHLEYQDGRSPPDPTGAEGAARSIHVGSDARARL